MGPKVFSTEAQYLISVDHAACGYGTFIPSEPETPTMGQTHITFQNVRLEPPIPLKFDGSWLG